MLFGIIIYNTNVSVVDGEPIPEDDIVNGILLKFIQVTVLSQTLVNTFLQELPIQVKIHLPQH